MSEIVERLLAEVSPDAPCGPDLEYDPEFVALGVAATPRPEQRIGDSVIAAADPDWRGVREQATALFGRTKDLRVAVTLARALVSTEGWAGLGDGLQLVRGLLERYWDGVHPRLEDGDATYRLNTLGALSDRDLVIPRLRSMPLVVSRRLGRFGLRDLDLASGALPKPADDESPAPGMSTIDAAFRDAEAGRVEADAEAIRQALEHVGAIESTCAGRLSGQSPDLSALRGVLASANRAFTERRGRLGAGGPAEEASVSGSETETGGAAGGGVPGEIRSREDVIRLLDRACEYFRRNEPSSPVPLLLERAKRLVSKSYLEIMRDLAPSGLSEAENVVGRSEEPR